MGFILEPKSGEDLMINGWNWRPTMAIIERAGILPSGERCERCLGNGCGGYFSEQEALLAADHIDTLLGTLNPNDRVLFDGEVTHSPIDFQKPVSEWDESDTKNHYSARYAVLKLFAEFCRSSGGFIVH